MSDTKQLRAPVSGTCARCGCALGFTACERNTEWFCCGACANSNRCGCGCKAEYARSQSADLYVPGRRMFASRRADGLKTRPGGDEARRRAFPFSDPDRGR
jgi:hypothetical protein